jgi:ATPase family associated with various cellular activities (AAA)
MLSCTELLAPASGGDMNDVMNQVIQHACICKPGSSLQDGSLAIAHGDDMTEQVFDENVALQVDSLATARGDDMNEATRRLLGVLLRFIDGFESTDSIVVAATNRKRDLDAALLSRCDCIVSFELPSEGVRAEILAHHATHLSLEVRSALGGCCGTRS